MRFNGAELMTVHPAISRSKEFPPGLAKRDITTFETSNGEIVADVTRAQDEYTVRVNIAARSYTEAMQARDRLAAWAAGSGRQAAWLEPTHAPGRAYKAIVKSVGRIEQRFGTVDVVFMLPDPVMYETMLQSHQATNKELVFQVAGSAAIQPEIGFTASSAAEGLKITHNGTNLFSIDGEISAGDEVWIALESGAVTVNGEHAEDRTVYTETDFDAEFEPGRHVLEASAEGTLRARWRNAWQ